VDARIIEAVDVVVGGEVGNGVASAVVDLSKNEPRLLRPGGSLTEARLRGMASEIG
jgi:tRNA A37 threonylcarbamoyladenosine synthetase subunit TsaC/SUA5/YrdC